MITIRLPDGYEYEIADPDEAADLEREMDNLGLGDALHGNHPTRLNVDVTDENYERLARALDHVRNAGNSGPDIDAVRDAILTRLRMPPLTYALRSWEFDGEDVLFWSYTGRYEESDRVVLRGGDSYRVVNVAQPATPARDGVLVVESWSNQPD
jgi:hypothetical protein